VSSKLRSLLAILGILVGTGSVVAMVLSGQLATAAALAQFKHLGTNMLSITLYDDNPSSSANSAKSATTKEFDQDSAMMLKNASAGIQLVAPYASLYMPISFLGETLNSGVMLGITQSLAPAIKIKMLKGRFISDLDHFAYFCVIGYDLYQKIKLLTLQDPIGQQLFLGKHIFTIIGVANKWKGNQFFNEDLNHAVMLPLSTATIISKYANIRNIVVRLNEDFNVDEVTSALSNYLEKNVVGKKPFIRSAKEFIESMANQRRILTILLGLIGSISLLVGGIGVMNIMLVSVVERKREIGIRKAVGAKRRDIRLLFLIEAVTLSLFGGVLGVFAGVTTAFIIAHFAHWNFVLFFTPIIIGFSVSVATGIFFGYYPAYKASLLDTITALRTD
jgi:putative ABC transport system permease protein